MYTLVRRNKLDSLLLGKLTNPNSKIYLQILNEIGSGCYWKINFQDSERSRTKLYKTFFFVTNARLERLTRDKHSSLLPTFVNYGGKKF
jgi:hypothetical protein